MSNKDDKKSPWYKDGLKFICTGCGKCCTGFPGYVWLNEKEAYAIAKHLEMPIEHFLFDYTKRVGNGLSLKELPKPYDCIFFKDNKCTIYPVRPLQCRTYPWWPDQLTSKEAWEETGKLCEGVNHPKAPIVSQEEIEKNLEKHLEEFLI